MRSLRRFCAAANARPISRSVAESNASLLEAFSHIIQAPETQGSAGKKFPIDFRANSLQPAPQFDPEPHGSAATRLTTKKFYPGDVLPRFCGVSSSHLTTHGSDIPFEGPPCQPGRDHS